MSPMRLLEKCFNLQANQDIKVLLFFGITMPGYHVNNTFIFPVFILIF